MKARENTAIGTNLYTSSLIQKPYVTMSPAVTQALLTSPSNVNLALKMAQIKSAETKAAETKKKVFIGVLIAGVVLGGGFVVYKATRD